MPIEVKTVKRVFNYNGTEMPDPNPTVRPEKVLPMLAATYPELATAKIEPPKVTTNAQGDSIHTFNIRVVGGDKG